MGKSEARATFVQEMQETIQLRERLLVHISHLEEVLNELKREIAFEEDLGDTQND